MRGSSLLRPGTLTAATAALLSPGLVLGAPLDAAVFVLAGSRIREGYVPYRDLWDHKPPGAFLLNAAGQVATPWLDPWLVAWLLTVAVTAAAILIIDSLLRRRLSSWAALFWSLVCVVGVASYPIALGGGATESFALLPLVAAVWAVGCRPRDWRTAAAIGCLCSIACLMSMQSLPAAIVLAGAGVIGAGGAAGLARRVLGLLAGGAILPLAVLAWLAAGGAVGDAYDQIVTYNAAYRASVAGTSKLLPATALLLSCVAVPAGVTVARMVRRPRSSGSVEWASLAMALGFTVYVGYQGRIYLHYLILLVPALVLLAGPGLQWLWANVRSADPNRRSLAIGFSAATACAFLISATVAAQLTGITLGRARDASDTTAATAAWIETNTCDAATLFVWGDDPVLYLSSGRAPYDRYVYQFPLVTAGYWSDARTAELLEKWRVAPPPAIVEGPSAVPMFRSPADTGDTRDFDTLQPLRDFVRENYQLAATFGDHDVYLPVATVSRSSGPLRALGAERAR
jgi:hypothetical protein